MTDNHTIDKYNILFASGVEFALRTGLSEKDGIEGASEAEIHLFCKKRKVHFPAALWSYCRYFGKKAQAKATDYNYGYSLATFDYALHQSRQRSEWHDMLDVRELLSKENFKVNYDPDFPDDNIGLYTPEIATLMNVEDIMVSNYDEFTRTFELIDSSKENPELFYLTKYYILTSNFITITNRYREALFTFITNNAQYDFAEMEFVDGKRVPISKPASIDYSDGFECLKVYQDLFKNENLDITYLKKLREQFYIINNQIEEKENRILSFTEFENNFISFIQDKLV